MCVTNPVGEKNFCQMGTGGWNEGRSLFSVDRRVGTAAANRTSKDTQSPLPHSGQWVVCVCVCVCVCVLCLGKRKKE